MDDVKNGVLKPNASNECIVPYHGLLPISFPNNRITIINNPNGSTTIEFGIDGGIDHYSSFYYADDKAWVIGLKKEKFSLWDSGVVLKLDDYWHVARF